MGLKSNLPFYFVLYDDKTFELFRSSVLLRCVLFPFLISLSLLCVSERSTIMCLKETPSSLLDTFATFLWKGRRVSLGNFAVTKITGKRMLYSLEMSLWREWIPTSVQTIQARTSEVGVRSAEKNGFSPGRRTCFIYHQFCPSLSWRSWNGRRLSHCARNIVLSFYVVVVVIAVKLWPVIYFFFWML